MNKSSAIPAILMSGIPKDVIFVTFKPLFF